MAVGTGVGVGTGAGVGVGVGSGVNVGAGVAVGGTGVSNASCGGARMVARPDGKFRGSTTGWELGSELGVAGTSACRDGTSVGPVASEPLQLNITVIRTKAMMPVNRCRPIPTVPILPASPGYVHN